MIYTARQLEELHKTNGHVRLPVGARMTPMAHDWLRSKRLTIVYADDEPQSPGIATHESSTANSPAPTDRWLWWCDGPCGAAKAAVSAQAKETNLQPII